MRKFIFISTLFVAFIGSAQSKLGLKFSPVFSSSRITLIDSLYDVNSGATKVKFSLGLIYDHELTETYYFSTGLILVPKTVGFNVRPERANNPNAPVDNPHEEYKLVYMQLPVTLKLYTNEVLPDGRIFFQVGLAAELKLNDLPANEDYTLITKFRGVDSTVLFGSGFEYRAGINTTLFAEVCYQRGLSNVVKSLQTDFQEELFIRSTIVSIDLGIKF